MSRKAVRVLVRRSSGSLLSALAGAWVQSWAQRSDPHLGWQDVAILAGLGAAWWLQKNTR